MGWSFETYDRGREAFLADITSKSHFGEAYTPIKSRVIGNNVWQAVRHEPTGNIFICLDLIAKDRKGGWGYKGMSEDMGPYQVNCPQSLLALCTEPLSESAKVWREKVQKYQAVKKAKLKPAPGLVVDISGRRYKLIEKLAPRKGWKVREIDGALYRLSAHQLSRALMEMAEVSV